jgi:hypothetical protein
VRVGEGVEASLSGVVATVGVGGAS